jgi:hypothetical protein
VRKTLIHRIKDKAIIKDIVLNDPDKDVRIEGLYQLRKDVEVLKEFAQKDPSLEVRRKATYYIEEKIGSLLDYSDTVLLGILARYSGNDVLQDIYLEKVTDEEIFKEVALSDENHFTRSAVLGRITDQAFILQIALNDEDDGVRFSAVRKLNDRDALAKIAREDQSVSVRNRAISKIDDPEFVLETYRGGLIDKEPAALRLAELSGYKKLSDDHKQHAGEILLMLHDPVLTKHFGKMKLSYRISERKHRYTYDFKHTTWVVFETLRVRIRSARGKTLYNKSFGEKTIPEYARDDRFEAEPDLWDISEKLLKRIKSEDLKEFSGARDGYLITTAEKLQNEN